MAMVVIRGSLRAIRIWKHQALPFLELFLESDKSATALFFKQVLKECENIVGRSGVVASLDRWIPCASIERYFGNDCIDRFDRAYVHSPSAEVFCDLLTTAKLNFLHDVTIFFSAGLNDTVFECFSDGKDDVPKFDVMVKYKIACFIAPADSAINIIGLPEMVEELAAAIPYQTDISVRSSFSSW